MDCSRPTLTIRSTQKDECRKNEEQQAFYVRELFIFPILENINHESKSFITISTNKNCCVFSYC